MATTITPTIVNLNVTQTVAATPSQLQQSGAIVSCGGTTLAAGTYQYCGAPSAVTAILAAPLAITSMAWASGTVTATVAAMTLSVGQTFTTTISGAVPAGYNGTYVATVVTSTTFSFALAVSPGTETTPGTYTPPYQAFVEDSITTFFAQGQTVGVYVLELGPEATSSAGITALGTWITANSNPQVFYAYLLARSWDGAALNTLAATYASPNGRTYFIPTSTSATVTDYNPNKSVLAVVPSPTAPATEEPAAAFLYQMLVNQPSAATPAGPLAFRYLYGVTAWALNSTALNTILTAYGNYIGTGSEGGISLDIAFKGTTADGTQFMWWYGIDWVAIQVKQALANAVINGSNSNPPLVYNQAGINSLLAVAQNVCNSAVAFQLVLSATVTATPFATYVQQNPNDYAAGLYKGFACTIVGQNGFLTVTFNIDATQFVA